MSVDPPPFEPPAPPPPADAEAEPAECPRCGAPYDLYQEYCLECGQRLVPLPPAYVRSEIWSRESPIWLWAALAGLLLVALVAGAIVAVAATQEEEPEGSPVVTTGPGTTDTIGTLDTAPTLTLSTGPTTLTIQTTTAGTTTLPTTTLSTTTTGTGTGTIISWPAGRDGYTIIVNSTPTREGRGEADAAARRAISAGLPQVGVLESSDYSSLNPGYYAAFTGIYDSQREAAANLGRVRNAGFPLAYVREVSD